MPMEHHRPDGPCDEQCGCVSEPAGGTSPSTVSLIAKHAPVGESAVACTLGADSLRGRLDDWQALLTHVARRTEIADGVRLDFDSTTPHTELMRLVAAEYDCCQFFRFAITVDSRGIALEVAAPADALPIVESLFGAPR